MSRSKLQYFCCWEILKPSNFLKIISLIQAESYIIETSGFATSSGSGELFNNLKVAERRFETKFSRHSVVSYVGDNNLYGSTDRRLAKLL